MLPNIPWRRIFYCKKLKSMRVEFVVEVPEPVAARLREQNADLGRVGLEKLVGSLYRCGELSQLESMRALNCPSRIAFEAILTRHHLHRDWSREEVERELAAVDSVHARA